LQLHAAAINLNVWQPIFRASAARLRGILFWAAAAVTFTQTSLPVQGMGNPWLQEIAKFVSGLHWNEQIAAMRNSASPFAAWEITPAWTAKRLSWTRVTPTTGNSVVATT
jgi:hypothetical protein